MKPEILSLPFDEQTEAIRAIVDRELPRPDGGFETDEQEQDWRDAQEVMFFDILHS